jgi:hypothetical protein
MQKAGKRDAAETAAKLSEEITARYRCRQSVGAKGHVRSSGLGFAVL